MCASRCGTVGYAEGVRTIRRRLCEFPGFCGVEAKRVALWVLT